MIRKNKTQNYEKKLHFPNIETKKTFFIFISRFRENIVHENYFYNFILLNKRV